jgi:sigma-E factor negative regulatory protein RseB
VPASGPRIRAGWLPEGFVMAARDRHHLEGRTGILNSTTYSDGLTAFTLFVEPGPAGSAEPGARRRGPTVVLARTLEADNEHFRATLVGEIPPATGRRILNRVALESGDD